MAASAKPYPARPEPAPDIHTVAIRPCLIVHRDLPDENAVRIERVLHGARDLRRLV